MDTVQIGTVGLDLRRGYIYNIYIYIFFFLALCPRPSSWTPLFRRSNSLHYAFLKSVDPLKVYGNFAAHLYTPVFVPPLFHESIPPPVFFHPPLLPVPFKKIHRHKRSDCPTLHSNSLPPLVVYCTLHPVHIDPYSMC